MTVTILLCRSVLTSLDEDTLVFVLGDHGMTSTGDHGGETEMETDAALLIYSSRPIFSPHQVSKLHIIINTLYTNRVALIGSHLCKICIAQTS